MTDIRVGYGYDVHALVEGRPCIIGGVTIPHDRGLSGHSDADVLCHAIGDALLGAAALGYIGWHFPDNTNMFCSNKKTAQKSRYDRNHIVCHRKS